LIAELKTATGVYRASVDKEARSTDAYKEGVSRLEGDRMIRQLDGYPDIGIPKGKPVFILSRDLFTFYFVRDHGKYRVANIGLE
jgi:hypothetical protein